jgi:nitroreductase
VKIIEEIVNRRSIREYSQKTIEPDKLERILEAARLAPTARNQQDWKQFLKGAPILIAACALNPAYVMRCGHPAYLIDLAIVLEHIALQAVREGLGTCWIGSFDEVKAKTVLNIPRNMHIVELMSIGYPAQMPPARNRKAVEDLICWDSW